jgi:hypothetical protein
MATYENLSEIGYSILMLILIGQLFTSFILLKRVNIVLNYIVDLLNYIVDLQDDLEDIKSKLSKEDEQQDDESEDDDQQNEQSEEDADNQDDESEDQQDDEPEENVDNQDDESEDQNQQDDEPEDDKYEDTEDQDDDQDNEIISGDQHNTSDTSGISQKQLNEHKTIEDIINFLNKPQELTPEQKNFSQIVNHLNSLPDTKKSIIPTVVTNGTVDNNGDNNGGKKFPKEIFLEKITQDNFTEEDFKDLWDIMDATSKKMLYDHNFSNQYFKTASYPIKESLDRISDITKVFNKNFSLPNISLKIGASFNKKNNNEDDDDVNAVLSLMKNTPTIEDVTNNNNE